MQNEYPFRDSSLVRHAVIDFRPQVSPFREKTVPIKTSLTLVETLLVDAPTGDVAIVLAMVGALFITVLLMIEIVFPGWSVTASGVIHG